MNATIRSHAVPSAGWALRRTPRLVLAKWWGVSPTRVSHRAKDGDNALTEILALVEHPDVDGAAIVEAVLEAFERRFLNEVRTPEGRAKLEARLAFLMTREHDREAAQNRALQTGNGVNDAIRLHISDLLEIAALRTVLGIETEDDS